MESPEKKSPSSSEQTEKTPTELKLSLKEMSQKRKELVQLRDNLKMKFHEITGQLEMLDQLLKTKKDEKSK